MGTPPALATGCARFLLRIAQGNDIVKRLLAEQERQLEAVAGQLRESDQARREARSDAERRWATKIGEGRRGSTRGENDRQG